MDSKPQLVQTLDNVIDTVKRYPEAHLLIGFGRARQYENVEAVERALEPYLSEIQKRVGDAPWLLIYGGDEPRADAPDVGLLAQRLASSRWGCRVLAPLLHLKDTPQPHGFLTFYHVMQPEYEDEFEGLTQSQVQVQQQQVQEHEVPGNTLAVSAITTAVAVAGPNTPVAECTPSDSNDLGEGLGAPTVAGAAEGGSACAAPALKAEGCYSAAVLGKRTRSESDGAAAKEGPQQDGEAAILKGDELAASRQRLLTGDTRQPTAGHSGQPGQRQQEGGAPEASADPGRDPASTETTLGTSDAATGGGSDRSGGSAAGGSVGTADGRVRKVVYGGIRHGRPAGPSKLLLDERLLGGSPGCKRLLTSVIVAGGAAVALQELEYAVSRGVPYVYIRSKAKNAPPPGEYGDYGPIDSWMAQHTQHQQEQEDQRRAAQ